MAMNLVCSYLAHPVDVARAASHYEKHAAGTYVVRGNCNGRDNLLQAY